LDAEGTELFKEKVKGTAKKPFEKRMVSRQPIGRKKTGGATIGNEEGGAKNRGQPPIPKGESKGNEHWRRRGGKKRAGDGGPGPGCC